MSIHQAIIDHTVTLLQKTMIDDLLSTDSTRAGVVKKGDLQGEPDPDVARISVTIHENDPDSIIGGGISSMSDSWKDEVIEVEVGGGRTWSRKFTVKIRCLLDRTRESLSIAQSIASTVKERLEEAILSDPFSNIVDGGQYVARGPFADTFQSEMIQSGGPPDSYDYFIKVRFDVWTSNT